MSTYWDQSVGRYLNFENGVMEALKSVADKIEDAANENINVVAGIRYDTDSQNLTDEQQENARTNIDAVSSAELSGAISNVTAPAFAQATANAAGTYVTNGGKLYYLPSGHTANTTWANTTKTEVTVGAELTDLKNASRLEADEIPDTVQSISFDSNGNVSQIVHKKRTDQTVTIRADVFTFSGNTITEVRTLLTGESLTIVTDTDTLVTTVTYADAA